MNIDSIRLAACLESRGYPAAGVVRKLLDYRDENRTVVLELKKVVRKSEVAVGSEVLMSAWRSAGAVQSQVDFPQNTRFVR